MAVILPFKAVRPAPEYAAEVAALPYDVYSRKEAAEFVKDRPLSFLNIDRPETAFAPEHDMYGEDVYGHARAVYQDWKEKGIFIQDEVPCYYVYELCMQGRRQTGIAALSSVDDYLNGICRKHENTVEEKEQDRIRHVECLSAQTGPIFLSYHDDGRIDELVREIKSDRPMYDFVAEDGIGHRLWSFSDEEHVSRLRELFSELGCTYIADGHHRAASAVKVALKRRAQAAKTAAQVKSEPAGSCGHEAPEDGFNEYDGFLSVLFPDRELRIYDYNRGVSDLFGHTKDSFLERLSKDFYVEMTGHREPGDSSCPDPFMRPERKYDIGMYLCGDFYRLRLREERISEVETDPRRRLDVSVLQELVLSPILGIKDPRTDSRISFVGGIRGLSELVRMVDEEDTKGGPAVAFAMYPTSMEELFSVADAGLLMPPKSTWFEPKLRSGLLIHEF